MARDNLSSYIDRSKSAAFNVNTDPRYETVEYLLTLHYDGCEQFDYFDSFSLPPTCDNKKFLTRQLGKTTYLQLADDTKAFEQCLYTIRCVFYTSKMHYKHCTTPFLLRLTMTQGSIGVLSYTTQVNENKLRHL